MKDISMRILGTLLVIVFLVGLIWAQVSTVDFSLTLQDALILLLVVGAFAMLFMWQTISEQRETIDRYFKQLQKK